MNLLAFLLLAAGGKRTSSTGEYPPADSYWRGLLNIDIKMRIAGRI